MRECGQEWGEYKSVHQARQERAQRHKGVTAAAVLRSGGLGTMAPLLSLSSPLLRPAQHLQPQQQATAREGRRCTQLCPRPAAVTRARAPLVATHNGAAGTRSTGSVRCRSFFEDVKPVSQRGCSVASASARTSSALLLLRILELLRTPICHRSLPLQRLAVKSQHRRRHHHHHHNHKNSSGKRWRQQRVLPKLP